MGKNNHNKKAKTYFVFITEDGTVGIAAGLVSPANCEVKAADKNLLLANGFSCNGAVFTRTGKLSLERAKKMLKEGRLVEMERIHVSSFLKRLDHYEEIAPSEAERIRKRLAEEATRRSDEEAKKAKRAAEEKEMEEKYPGFNQFRKDFYNGKLEKHGFRRPNLGEEEYEKNGVRVGYYGSLLAYVYIDDKDIEDMGFDLYDVKAELAYRLNDYDYRFWTLVLERVRK